MKCLFLALILASGMVFAAPGGYIHKGGVIDFQKPLDYMDHAVHAGRVAWNTKFEQELEQPQEERGARNAAQYIPTFYTSQSNHAALNAARPVFNSDGSFQRPARQIQPLRPLYYPEFQYQY